MFWINVMRFYHTIRKVIIFENDAMGTLPLNNN